MGSPRRYALCGLSNRGLATYALPLLGVAGADRHDVLGYGDVEDLSSHGTLAAVLEPDAERAAEFNARLVAAGRRSIPCYPPDALDVMVRETGTDCLIVAGPDRTHAESILPALEARVDVIAEKPMVSTAAAAGAVLAADAGSTAELRVAHNYRYVNVHREVKRLLLDGAVGRVTHVTMEYHLDRRHGPSFFVRWNRQRSASGGLSVHKCCHHFDLLNWWIAARPVEVFGYGALNHFGPRGAHNPALADPTLSPSELRALDPYALADRDRVVPSDDDGPREGLFGLHYPGQYPGGRTWSIYDGEIDVEDTYSAVLSYDSGVSATYSIDFSSTWEGHRTCISGTFGTLDVLYGRTVDGDPLPGSHTIVVRELFGGESVHQLPVTVGGHGGADALMQRDLFVHVGEESRRLNIPADGVDGAVAVAVGEGLWRSVVEHRPMRVDDLLAGR